MVQTRAAHSGPKALEIALLEVGTRSLKINFRVPSTRHRWSSAIAALAPFAAGGARKKEELKVAIELSRLESTERPQGLQVMLPEGLAVMQELNGLEPDTSYRIGISVRRWDKEARTSYILAQGVLACTTMDGSLMPDGLWDASTAAPSTPSERDVADFDADPFASQDIAEEYFGSAPLSECSDVSAELGPLSRPYPSSHVRKAMLPGLGKLVPEGEASSRQQTFSILL